MQSRKTKIVLAAAAAAACGSVGRAAPLANLQVLASTTQNGTYTSTLTITPSTTYFFEVVGQLAPSGTNNNAGNITSETANDGINSLKFNLTDSNTGASFSSLALATTGTSPAGTANWAGGSGAAAGNASANLVTAIRPALQSGVGTGIIEIGQFTAPASFAASQTINGSWTTGGSGSLKINNAAKTVFITNTTETGSDPVVGYTPLTLTETALAWDGAASNAWDTSSLNWTNGSAAFATGNAVTFGDFALNGTTAVQHTNPIAIVSGGVAPSSVTFTNTSANTYRFTAADSNGITGSASVAINGGGTVIFSSPNGYSGGTTITNGTLKAASGSLLSTGNLTIGASGKLFIGDGSSSAPSTLATGNQTWTGGGSFITKVDGTGTLTGPADQLTIGGGTGTLTLSGSGAFTIVAQPGDVVLGTPQTGTMWQIATFGSLSGYTGPTAIAGGVNPGAQFTLDTSAFGAAGSGLSLDLIQLDANHEALDLVYAPTPEPATMILAVGGAIPMLLGRRRKRAQAMCVQAI